MSAVLALHVLAAGLWLGSLFFANAVLRPDTDVADPPARLALSHRMLRHLLLWSWLSAGTLLVSGIAAVILVFGGSAALPVHVRAMMALGVAATLLFGYLHAIPWRRFVRSLRAADWTSAERRLRQIRLLFVWVLAAAAAAAVAAVA